MKKLISIVLVVMLVSLTAASAFACGGSHHGTAGNAGYAGVCSVQNCALTGRHYHDGKIYSSHYFGDGHAYCRADRGHH